MIALAKFLPYVLPHVPACPEVLAEQALLSASIEFCAQTLLIQELTTGTAMANNQDYTIEVPASMVLVKVLGVMYGDRWLVPNSIENVRSGLALRGSIGGDIASSATPQVYFQKTPTSTEISLYPVQPTTLLSGLAVRAAFTPSRSSTTVPDVLFDTWAEAIAAGALSRLMAMPAQPFSSPGAAGMHRTQFDLAVRKASIVARVGQVAASSRVQLTHFA